MRIFKLDSETLALGKDAVALGNRILDYLEGKQQREIDALVEDLKSSTDGLVSTIPVTPKP